MYELYPSVTSAISGATSRHWSLSRCEINKLSECSYKLIITVDKAKESSMEFHYTINEINKCYKLLLTNCFWSVSL